MKQEFICDRNGCEETYTKKTHNQKYCSDNCCRIATNARIMVDYYKEQARLNGQARYCENCTGRLSRYNPYDVCEPCTQGRRVNANESVRQMLVNASLI